MKFPGLEEDLEREAAAAAAAAAILSGKPVVHHWRPGSEWLAAPPETGVARLRRGDDWFLCEWCGRRVTRAEMRASGGADYVTSYDRETARRSLRDGLLLCFELEGGPP